MNTVMAIVFDAFETLFANTREQWLHAFADIILQQDLSTEPLAFWDNWREVEGTFRSRRVPLENLDNLPPFITYEQAWHEAFRETFTNMHIQGDPIAATDICIQQLSQRSAYEDALRTLPIIRATVSKVALLSNADNSFLNPVLTRWPVTSFDAVLSSETARLYKPHPQIFRSILSRLNTPPNQAIYVGDSLLEDIHGAKQIGMTTIWINRRGKDRDKSLCQPDYETANLMSLPKLVASVREEGLQC